MLSIVTWNVNSVKARLSHLVQFLRDEKPDILLLQELKCQNDAFPAMEVEELGYNLALHGQKTYNGVAVLSKFPLSDVRRGLPGDDTDAQARYIEAVVSMKGGALRVASVYVPNGQETDSDKFAYKMRFYARMQTHFAGLLALNEMTIVGGDFNVAPFPIDVHAPKQWDKSVLFCPPAREALRALLHQGWQDAFRLLHPEARDYSWWDYRENAWPANQGLRIDHLLLSPQAADRLSECDIMKAYRDVEKPSDHAPVRCGLEFS